MKTDNIMAKNLMEKIQNKTAVLGVVGLGYVGLPLAVEKAKSGYQVIGFDVQDKKVEMVNQGHNYIGDVVDAELAQLVKEGRLTATSDFAAAAAATAWPSACPPRWTSTISRTSPMWNPPQKRWRNTARPAP